MKASDLRLRFWLLLLLASGCAVRITAQTAIEPDSIPTVAYCELVNNAVTYDQKVVQLKATYFVAFEGSVLFARDCEEKRTWVRYDPAFAKASKRAVRKKFDRLTDTSPIKSKDGGILLPSRQVEVTWVGCFSGIKPTYKMFDTTYTLGFGHMNAFDYQFLAMRVEDVVSTPISSSRR